MDTLLSEFQAYVLSSSRRELSVQQEEDWESDTSEVIFGHPEAEYTIIMHVIRSSHHPDYMLFQPYPYANAHAQMQKTQVQPHTLPNKSSCPPPKFCFGAAAGAAAGAAVVLTGLA